jgi:hypothetical protein
MRCLAQMQCSACGARYYEDLPAGHGLLFPSMIDVATGEVCSPVASNWFSDLLRDSYKARNSQSYECSVVENRPVRNGVLLNCLDSMYGHALLKLLNAQYYVDKCPEVDLIVIVPRYLEWMVPDGVARVVTFDQPLNDGGEWNDWIALEVARVAADCENLSLAIALPHPSLEDLNIDRFTRVKPFDVGEASESASLVVTAIWRDDRVWWPGFPRNAVQRFGYKIARRLGFIPMPQALQKMRYLEVESELRRLEPNLDFAIIGVGTPGGLPDLIRDLRVSRPTADIERQWCARYAQSFAVFGVQGSNMILPSAHAGMTVDLLDPDHYGNLGQDVLPQGRSLQDGVTRTVCVPMSVSAESVARLIYSQRESSPYYSVTFNRPWNDHEYIRTRVSSLRAEYDRLKRR